MTEIAQHILDKYAERGKTLFAAKAIVDTLKHDNNHYTYYIKDGQLYEVNRKNQSEQNDTYTCECNDYQKEGYCPHIHAVRLHSDFALSNKESKKQNYSVKYILNNIDQDQLSRFVKSAAQRDRKFSFMLRGAFATQLNNTGSSVYKDLLSQLVKPVRIATGKSNAGDIRLAVTLINEFHDQLQDAITLGQYNTSVDIMVGTWNYIHYLYRHQERHRSQLEPIIKSYNLLFSEMYKQPVAPQLKEKMEEALREVCALSYYNFIDKEYEPLLTLYLAGRKLLSREIFIDKAVYTLDNQYDIIYNSLLYLLDGVPAYDTISTNNSLKISDLLVQWIGPEVANGYLHEAIAHNDIPMPLEIQYVKNLISLDEHSRAVNVTVEKYTKTKNYRYLKPFLQENSAIADDLKKQLDQTIPSLRISAVFKATYYYDTDNLEMLLSELNHVDDVDTLMDYSDKLYDKKYSSLEALILVKVKSYLMEHSGPYVKEYLDLLSQKLKRKKHVKLVAALRKNFSDLSTL